MAYFFVIKQYSFSVDFWTMWFLQSRSFSGRFCSGVLTYGGDALLHVVLIYNPILRKAHASSMSRFCSMAFTWVCVVWLHVCLWDHVVGIGCGCGCGLQIVQFLQTFLCNSVMHGLLLLHDMFSYMHGFCKMLTSIGLWKFCYRPQKILTWRAVMILLHVKNGLNL
jgi:hypothetical protein